MRYFGGCNMAFSVVIKIHMFKFEGVLIPGFGHVALDDIQVYSDKCPVTDTCTFEDGECNYIETNYNTGHWVRRKAGDIVDDDSHQQFTDHTLGTVKGHLMYCCSQAVHSATPAKLISPLYKANPEGRCLMFWSKQSRYSKFKVQLLDKEGHISYLADVYDSKSWVINQFNIRSLTDFQVVFLASGTTPKAVDDIQVNTIQYFKRKNTITWCS
ncbi:MAM and LDL-receptor class A domain-containing protein 2 [Elysia marginata]|uniref:MAM and LDL-receptor class A domain-containing protein 2 n=1 Tax=Elysia marginata TaxID=1093978 RepID=A0AAV4H205_9GAST|nr:MAM and LDL-receptor class A domain-containing protein 2 [Elysia marginata]